MIVFDLDGTLAESKQPLDSEMAELLARLLRVSGVSIISGCSFSQFREQVLERISCRQDDLANLFLFPTNATAFYKYESGEWTKIYEKSLSSEDKVRIVQALEDAEETLGFSKEEPYGEKIEDRQTQITYSGRGQLAPISEKEKWDPDQSKRRAIVQHIHHFLPDFEIRIGGMTSIDITQKGIDKAYGIRQIEETFDISPSDITFVGDALFPGGNDYPAKSTGVNCVEVKGIEDTKNFIRSVIEG